MRALAEKHVRGNGGESTDREPAPGAKGNTRSGDDHRHGLHVRDRREEHASRRGDATQRRDERDLPGRVAALLEPRETPGDERGRGDQCRETSVGRVEGSPEHRRTPEAAERQEREPRPQP